MVPTIGSPQKAPPTSPPPYSVSSCVTGEALVAGPAQVSLGCAVIQGLWLRPPPRPQPALCRAVRAGVWLLGDGRLPFLEQQRGPEVPGTCLALPLPTFASLAPLQPPAHRLGMRRRSRCSPERSVRRPLGSHVPTAAAALGVWTN